MKLDISVKYLLKSLIPILIILTVFIWDGKITRKMQECFMRSSDALSVPLLFLFQ
uniref:Colicin 1B immunity protein n=1 Tax=Escherichia coli TaxID=562 RepID=A0A3G4RT77_ECOLX|nr:colicin 1B immunity protein [Escherichia coli]